jgi:lysylphosphatidylglycerol synthetase-like protein (DUF2156 family)
MNDKLFRLGAVVVLVHTLVSLPHGLAHAGENAWLPLWGNIYVVLVIGVAPFVALALLRTRQSYAGAQLMAASMLGALLFGIAFHYLIPGVDNVAHVPLGPWWLPFQLTSALLVASEAAGTIAGVWMVRSLRRELRLV